jgi:hypothetical protein
MSIIFGINQHVPILGQCTKDNSAKRDYRMAMAKWYMPIMMCMRDNGIMG